MSNHNKETKARCTHCYRHYVEGTAAWALYMMRMGHKVTNPMYDPRVYHLPEGGMIHVNGIESIAGSEWIDYWCIDVPDGWQLYEEPKPANPERWVCYECGVKDSRKGHFPGCSRIVKPKPTYAAPQDIINYMFAAWVKSGMYYKDFDRHVIDMMNGLMERTIVCYGDEDDDNIGIIPLRVMLDRQVHSMRLKPLKIYRHGENIRYIPNIEEDYIHSPINEKILEQMEDLMAVALWGIMREEDNDDAAHWKAYKMSIGPIYSYNISDEMGGKAGGCLTKEQLLGKYERAVEDMFNEFGEEKGLLKAQEEK